MKNKILANDTELDKTLSNLIENLHNGLKDKQAIALVGIHRRGVPLSKRIRDKLKNKYSMSDILTGTLDITLYRDDIGYKTGQPVVRQTDIPFDVTGKHIVVVDDVLYTGRTIRAALDAIMDLGRPHVIELLVLVERNGRELPIAAQYVGTSIEVSADERVQVRLTEIDGEDSITVSDMKE